MSISWLPATMTTPLVITTSGVTITASDGWSRFGRSVSVPWEGPAVVWYPQVGHPTVPYPTLSGAKLRLNSSNQNNYWDLRDAPGWELYGLTALTIECFLTQDTVTSDPRHLINSSGRAFISDSTSTSLVISIANGVITFGLRTTSYVEITSGATVLSSGVASHISCVYDGSQMRLYIAGTLVASASQTGAINQGDYESVILGGFYNTWYGDSLQEEGITGYVEDLRLSNIARRTSNFNPATFVATDSNDLFRMYNPALVGPLVSYIGLGQGPGYLLTRSRQYQVGTQTFGCLKEVTFTGNTALTPVMALGAVGLEVQNVYAGGSRYGVYLDGNSYNSMVWNCELNGGTYGRGGLVNVGVSGAQHFDDSRVQGYDTGLVCGTGSLSAEGLWIVPKKAGIWAGCNSDPGVSLWLRDTFVTHENTPATDVILASNIATLNWAGGSIDTRIGNPPFRFRNILSGGKVTLTGLHVTYGPVTGTGSTSVQEACDGEVPTTSDCYFLERS